MRWVVDEGFRRGRRDLGRVIHQRQAEIRSAKTQRRHLPDVVVDQDRSVRPVRRRDGGPVRFLIGRTWR